MIINGYFIGVAGVSDRVISARYRLLAETIGEEIMRRGHRLISGGCAGGITHYCTEKAADYLIKNNLKNEIKHRILSILPDDKIPDQKYTTISIGNKFVCQGMTRSERRPFMASLMDSLITINGGNGTKAEIEACLDIGTPILPISQTGGESLNYWNLIKPMFNNDAYPYYKGSIVKKYEDLEKVNLNNQERIGKLAVDIAIELAKKKHKCRCTPTMAKSNNVAFIVMPFDKKFDEVFLAIKEIFEKGIYALPLKFNCIRHDDVHSGRIDESLLQYISDASLLIVDVTGNNPNVLCEYGIGVGFRKKQILINQSPKESAADIANEIQISYDLANLKRLQEELVQAIRDRYENPGS
jgi:predicted Rossmann-fold nucleotide-binding protein